jgi:hypothetical protein
LRHRSSASPSPASWARRWEGAARTGLTWRSRRSRSRRASPRCRGYEVAAVQHPLDATNAEWGASRYFTVTVRAKKKLSDLLAHLYVLVPVLDALREFALGLEGLERFVRREPLRRVHECVFGVLALESEPVDPRL